MIRKGEKKDAYGCRLEVMGWWSVMAPSRQLGFCLAAVCRGWAGLGWAGLGWGWAGLVNYEAEMELR